ncbi:MAG: sulfite exporter TauE/SafE family protein [Chloroflexi bacterium]|nr:sulfite exporter TauE/SafE family protein [Chloroflexota bacterium]
MTNASLLIAVGAAIFFGALIQSTVGFGSALIAMPLLTRLLGLHEATALFGVISMAMSVVLLALGHRRLDLRESWQLNVAAILGVPVGLWVLQVAPESFVLHGLGALLLIYGGGGLWLSRSGKRIVLSAPQWLAWPMGFISGILGGAYNTNGPPLVVYGTLRRWEPEKFRVTLQTVFFTSSIAIALGHASAGFWHSSTFVQALLCLPLLWLAAQIGRRLTTRIDATTFVRWVYAALIVLGVSLLAR